MGKCSFWSIQMVSVLPLFSVTSHLSQERPLMDSVPTFLQVAPSRPEQGSLPLNMSWNFGMRCVIGLFWSVGNSMYICWSVMSMYMVFVVPSTIMLILPPMGPEDFCWPALVISIRILGSEIYIFPLMFRLPCAEVVDISAEKGCGICANAEAA